MLGWCFPGNPKASIFSTTAFHVTFIYKTIYRAMKPFLVFIRVYQGRQACVLRIQLLTIRQQISSRRFAFALWFSPEPNKGLMYQLQNKVNGKMTANLTQAYLQTPVSQHQWAVLHQGQTERLALHRSRKFWLTFRENRGRINLISFKSKKTGPGIDELPRYIRK